MDEDPAAACVAQVVEGSAGRAMCFRMAMTGAVGASLHKIEVHPVSGAHTV